MQTGTSFLSGCSVVVLLFAALQWEEREREMITLLEPSRSGLETVLVMTDIFTKYTLPVPIRD